MSDDFSKLSDDDIVSKGYLPIGGEGQSSVHDGRPDPRYRIEMMRRLMVSIDRMNRSTTIFSWIMGGLTVAILIFTVIMAFKA